MLGADLSFQRKVPNSYSQRTDGTTRYVRYDVGQNVQYLCTVYLEYETPFPVRGSWWNSSDVFIIQSGSELNCCGMMETRHSELRIRKHDLSGIIRKSLR